MNVLEAINARQSIRAYQSKPIEAAKLDAVLAAANRAASAANLQAYRIYVVRDEARKQALVAAAAGQKFLASAPVVLVFAVDPARSAVKYGPRGAHLYLNHLDQAREQLSRTPYPLPTMRINPDVKDIFGFKYEDFKLENYQAHPHIKASVAV